LASPSPAIGIAITRQVASIVLGGLGHLDRARRLREQAIELAREGDPFDLAQLLASSELLLLSGAHELARESAEEAIAISEKHGFPFLLVQARMNRGWAIGGPDGLEEARQSLAQMEAAGMRVFLPSWLAYTADIMRELGQTDDALSTLQTALAIAGETGACAAHPLLYRLKGELLPAREAESCLRRALDLAGEMRGKLEKLRTATSLARLRSDQGRRDEARALLQPVYDWFTEGFDTADLKDAKALLGELA
jgi:tetratricopeptide (TPR) repeat protein